MAASCASARPGSTAVHVPSTIAPQAARTQSHARTAREGRISIIDRRELEFDARALISIIARSARWANSVGLPSARPVRVEFDPAGSRIVLGYDGAGTDIITAERLGALLVSYCVRARVPLPRLAEKSVRIEANSVVVGFTTYFSEVPEGR
jgi:hypothetical protein